MVPSFTQQVTIYVVDMSNGFCTSHVGHDGSPCTHQYAIWVSNPLYARNFLPVFSKEERQKYSKIVSGYYNYAFLSRDDDKPRRVN